MYIKFILMKVKKHLPVPESLSKTQTLGHRQDMIKSVLNLKFSFTKDLSLFHYLPNAFVKDEVVPSFCKGIKELQTALFRIWTWVTNSTFITVMPIAPLETNL